jgi:hypothetical protein
VSALAFNGEAGRQGNLAGLFIPLDRDEELGSAPDAANESGTYESTESATYESTKAKLLSHFGGAAAPMALAVAPDLPRTSLNGDRPDALSVLAARGMGIDRKITDAALTGSLSSAFKDANAPQQQNQAPALSPAQQAFLNKLNSDPEFAQTFVDHVNKVTTALDQPQTEKINSFQTVRPDFDLQKHDETCQQNFCQADDAKNSVEELKNIMEAHAEEMKAAEAAPDPMQPPAAVQAPEPGKFTMSANEVQSPEETVQVAAHGRGTGGVQGGELSRAADDQTPGYTGVSAAAPQPAQAAQPAANANDGRMFIHGPGLTDEGGKSRIAMTQDGKLEIDGMGMDQLENTVNTIHRESKMAAEVVDTIATKGVTTSVAEAADLVHGGGLDASQVNVNRNGTAQVFQLARNGGGPGGMG